MEEPVGPRSHCFGGGMKISIGFLRVHVKVVTPPIASVGAMIGAASQVYAAAGMDIILAETESIPDGPTVVQVDENGSSLTSDQIALFSHRNQVEPGEIAAYVVDQMIPPQEGFAAHPTDLQACVLAYYADRYNFAHEVGHLLGLLHVDDDTNLMWKYGTSRLSVPVPTLNADQISTIQHSPLFRQYPPSTSKVMDLLFSSRSFAEKASLMPKDGDDALAVLSSSDDIGAASRAVYMAGLRNTKKSAAILDSAASHPHATIRVLSMEVAKRLRSAGPEGRQKLKPKRRSTARRGEKREKTRS